MRSRLCVALTFLLTACLGLASTAQAQSNFDNSGLHWLPTAYEFVVLDPSAGGTLGATAVSFSQTDYGETDVTLPWAFPFYGNSYTTMSVGVDALISFEAGGNLGSSNTSLPTTGTYNRMDIALFWDDLSVNGNGTGEVWAADDPTNSRYILSWEGVQRDTTSDSGSFQLHLYQDGRIAMHWADTDFGSASYNNGASATIGVQDRFGGSHTSGNYLQVSHNTASVIDGTAIMFSGCVDADGDGGWATSCDGDDCDDADPTRFAANPEICADGIDQNCNGYDLLTDLDQDGDLTTLCGGNDCDDLDASVNSILDADGDGFVGCDECDDSNAATYPGAEELCDGEDNDCDGNGDAVDDADGDTDTLCNGDCDDNDAVANTLDADGDGITSCDGDCDDTNAAIFPDAPEVCDGVADDNCDGVADVMDDNDADGETVCAGDCDDADAAVNTTVTEVCNDSIDNNCSGGVDDLDADLDDYVTSDCGGDDCNDADAAVNPGAAELCDGADFDSDCDGLADNVDLSIGAISPGVIVDLNVSIDISHTYTGDLDVFLTSPSGTTVELTTNSGSSGNDFTDTVFDDEASTSISSISSSGAPHTGSYQPEGSLADFDGEASLGTWTLDVSDDYGGDSGTVNSWTLIFETATGNTSITSSPAAFVDNNTSVSDSAILGLYDVVGDDADNDGYVDSCGDCDAADATANPGGVEICGDGIDQDCDGSDLGGILDADADGQTSTACGGTDCDDNDATAFAGNTETCDGANVDNDCDGVADNADLDINFIADSIVSLSDTPALDLTPAGGDATLTVSGSVGNILDVNVSIDITIPYNGDLDISLIHPDGTTEVALSLGNGSYGDNYTGTIFDDEATVAIAGLGASSAPFTGSYQPEGSLSDFAGLAADGAWTLHIVDTWPGSDDGLLNSWSIDIETDADGDGLSDGFTDDADGDGYVDSCGDCLDASGAADPSINPGAVEVCGDTIDQDCDGSDLVIDADADGEDCTVDCDDNNAAVSSTGTEVCGDALDNDCDGNVDNIDADGDGYSGCTDDCDDADAGINPGAVEVCDGADVDGDCDGVADNADLDINFVTNSIVSLSDTPALDLSGAGGDATLAVSGSVGNILDVNVSIDITIPYNGDLDISLIHPDGTTEVALSLGNGSYGDNYTGTTFDDEATVAIAGSGASAAPFTGSFQPEGSLSDFDGSAADGNWTLHIVDTWPGSDHGLLNSWSLEIETDADGDGLSDGFLDDADGDGYVDSCGDCLDASGAADSSINPGATEICGDGIDQDCDLADLVVDVDADGASDAACGGDDCDDNDATVSPTATETCDGSDNDCDGLGADGGSLAQGGLTTTFVGGNGSYGNVFDVDALNTVNVTGFEWNLDSTSSATVDIYYRAGTGLTAGIHDEATEWTLLDQLSVTGEGSGNPTQLTLSTPLLLNGGQTYSFTFHSSVDIDYTNGGTVGDVFAQDDNLVFYEGYGKGTLFSSFYNSPRVWNGTIQYGATSAEADVDGDGYVGCTWVGTDPAITGGDDCDNGNATINPSATELCDGIDNDCNGSADFDSAGEVDADGDTYISCDDCDDDPTTGVGVNPAAAEDCTDAIDQNCDGVADLDDADGDGAINSDCGGDDCDDDPVTGVSINPNAAELCNDTIDNDCDPTTADVADNDGDGFDCIADCDDDNDWAFPGFFEWCNDGVDNDCDPATVDTGDQDGDGVDCLSDCDDSNLSIFPGAIELLCTGLDEDCDTTGNPDIDDGDGDSFNCDVECDDSDPAVNPGALEIPCDGIDNDCDVSTEGDTDDDGDGSLCNVDCDDADATRSPDFDELCDDSIDNDCDPATDDIHDFDADGSLCTADCDDDDALSYPGAPEVCADGVDQDCDGTVDEASDGAYALDDDDSLHISLCSFSFPFCGTDWDTLYVQDNGRLTFGADDQTSTESVTSLLAQAPQIAALWTDLNPSQNGTIEVVETESSDIAITFTAIPEFGVAGTANTFTVTLFPDGTAGIDYGNLSVSDGLVGFACGSTVVEDVDLSDYEIIPGAVAIGTGTEDAIYEQFSNLGSPNDLANLSLDLCLSAGTDADGDGWTDTCGDCDDAEATTYPGADELCDSSDNDCDGTADNVDLDGDTFTDLACGGDDCDDSNADVNTSATEVCNGIDDDCDGSVEDNGADADADGFLLCEDDCDDSNADVNPEADEVCDSIDNNCDSEIDEGFTVDLDEDGYRNEACGGDDCDDTRASTYPDADEICDLVDNDCDDTVDEVDADLDGFVDANCGGDDCDDANEAVNPDAEEVPYDGIDNDCEAGDLQDADGDQFLDAEQAGGSDCNDNDATIFPGAAEVCDDDVDNDCDELVDKDDEECAGCSCEASLVSSRSDAGAGLMLVLLIGVIGSLRRRRD